jgi:hypothetical protein
MIVQLGRKVMGTAIPMELEALLAVELRLLATITRAAPRIWPPACEIIFPRTQALSAGDETR